MFEFLKRMNYENKKAYKRRINQRGSEILNGINCTDEEKINLEALIKCQARFMLLHGEFIGIDLNKDEYDLKKGTAKDYEKYIEALYFNHLDLKKFEKEKAKLWEDLFSQYSSYKTYLGIDIEDISQKRLYLTDKYPSEYQGITYSKKPKPQDGKRL